MAHDGRRGDPACRTLSIPRAAPRVLIRRDDRSTTSARPRGHGTRVSALLSPQRYGTPLKAAPPRLNPPPTLSQRACAFAHSNTSVPSYSSVVGRYIMNGCRSGTAFRRPPNYLAVTCASPAVALANEWPVPGSSASIDGPGRKNAPQPPVYLVTERHGRPHCGTDTEQR